MQNPFLPTTTESFEDGALIDELYQRSASVSTPGTGPSGATEQWCANSLYHPITTNLANVIYGGSLVAKIATEIIPQKGFRLLKGWKSSKGKTPAWVKDAYNAFTNLVTWEAIQAGIMGRQYCDAYLVLFWDDGEPDTVFNPNKATRLIGAVAKSRCTLEPEHGESPELAEYFVHVGTDYDKNDAEVESEQLHDIPPYQGYKRFHTSRVIRIPGLIASNELRAQRQGYNLSIYDYLDQPLREWIAGKYASIDMLKNNSPFVYKMKHFAMKSLRKETNNLWSRFRTLMNGLKYMGGLILDKDQEDASYLSRSYGSVDKLMMAIDSFMSSNSDVPQPYLLDKESAFSEDNLSARYEMAGILQEYCFTHVTPFVNSFLLKYAQVFVDPNTTKEDLFHLYPSFDSGLELTRMEKAEIYFRYAQGDVLYLTPQVLNNETVQSRWRDGSYHDDMVVTGKLLSSEDVKKENEEAQQMAFNQKSLAASAGSSKPGKNSSPTRKANPGGEPTKKKSTGK